MIMVHMHLKLHLGLCVGGGGGGGGAGCTIRVGGLSTLEGREGGMVVVDGLSAHQTLTMGASGRRIAHRVPWGARYRGNGAVGARGVVCVCEGVGGGERRCD